MKRFTSPAFLLVCALTQTTCVTNSLLDLASDFSTERSCPKASLTIKSVPILPEDLEVMPTPPDEVAADPARLAVWKKTRKELWMDRDHLTAVAVSGCGLHSTKLCWEERGNKHNDNDSCYAIDLTDPRFIDPAKGKALQERLDAAPAVRP